MQICGDYLVAYFAKISAMVETSQLIKNIITEQFYIDFLYTQQIEELG